MMERAAWTDARLDDFQRNVDARFDQVDARFDRVDARFDRLEREVRDFRGEVHLEFGAMRSTMIWVGATVGGGILAGLLGVIATLLSQG